MGVTDNERREIPKRNQKEKKLIGMKSAILFSLATLTWASPAPQYSGQTQDLSEGQLDTIKDIFGDAAGDAYSGDQQTGRLEGGTNGVEAIIQVVKNEDGYVAPDDYQQTQGALTDKATSNVDNVFENCADFTAPPPPPIVKHVPKCGQRHENGLGVRIQGFNEYESQFGEWPHMCAVLAEEPVAQDPGYAGEPQTVNLYQCGGSLIAPGVILAAAHCAAKFQQEPTKLKIRCGEWDTQNQTEPRPHQDRYVQALDIHPEFNPRNLANDWAVLYTAQNFDLQAHIDTVCLPEPEELFDGQSCFATGWGKDQFGAAGNYQVVLKEIDLPVVGHDQCEASLRTTRLGKRFQLDDSFICAGGVDGKDTCKGDGGSPLVCQSKFDPTSYVQAGIVAWGIGCGEDNTPGVYASVSKGVCWIDYAMSCKFGQVSGSFSSYWGYSAQQCQTWMDGELIRLNQEVADMQNAGNLTGRKKAAALAKGVKAQETLNKYSQCNVFWQPIDAAPLTTGGNGYVDGGDVDISNFERDNYPAAPLTDATDGYSEPKTVDSAPLTDDSYSETKAVDAAPLTDGSYSEPKTAPQTEGSYDDAPPVKLTQGAYTEDTADLTGEVKAPGPVY